MDNKQKIKKAIENQPIITNSMKIPLKDLLGSSKIRQRK